MKSADEALQYRAPWLFGLSLCPLGESPSNPVPNELLVCLQGSFLLGFPYPHSPLHPARPLPSVPSLEAKVWGWSALEGSWS